MEINISLIISCLIVAITSTCMILKLNNIKINSSILKFFLTSIFLLIYLYFSYLITSNFIRYATFLLFVSIIITQIYKINIIKSICTVFFSWMFFLISEIVFTIIIIGIFKLNIVTFYGGIIGNLIISILSLTIFSIPKIQNFINKLVTRVSNLKNIMSILLLMILALSFSIILYINSFNDKDAMNFVLSLVIMFIQIAITILFFIEKNHKQIIKYEYDSLLNNLEEYETMLDFQRVANHENKNQLLVIKGMIEKNDMDTVKYINSIVKEKHEDNESFLYHTNKIPSGGLRGLIYYKILLMKEKKILVDLNIDKSVRKIKFDKIDIDTNKDLCKIIGVLLDNAIEAVENLEQKKIQISLNYYDNLLKITVANNFIGEIDICNIENKGYTTKGKGHGYGLSLVKNLIEKNKRIKNIKEINANVFKQNIILDCNEKSAIMKK